MFEEFNKILDTVIRLLTKYKLGNKNKGSRL